LRESESNFRNFVEQSSEGISLINERGRIVEWNSGAEQLTGLERETVLNTPLWEVQVRLLPEERRTPEAREHYRAMILVALETGEAPWLGQMSEIAYQRADGEKHFVQQRVFPIEMDGGFWLGTISIDVTERKEAEEELRKLSRAVEQSDGTIIITDAQGTIEFVNPSFSRITGYSAAEAIGQNPCLLKSGEMRPEVYEDLWATITQGEVWEGELLNRKKDGQLFWESAIISPVKDSNGEITHYVAVKEDITERKKAGAALQEAHDRLEQRVAERTAELREAVQSLRQEVIQREQAEAETREWLIVQQRLASMSTALIQATDFEQAVAHTPAKTGGLVGASRVFLVRLQSDGNSIYRIHEWCAPGVAPIFHRMEDWRLSGVPWLLEELRERGWFYVNDIFQFPQ
jgi:PAS domain S-box-containing protein